MVLCGVMKAATDHRIPTLRRWVNTCALFLISLLCSSCVRVVPSSPNAAFREVTAPSLMDDLELGGLSDAINAELPILKRSPDKTMVFGPVTMSRATYVEGLERLLEILSQPVHTSEKLQYIAENFRFFEFFGGNSWGEVLLTSYFEPVIPGSREKTKRFSRPLLAKPKDLLTVSLEKFSDRFKDEKPLRARLENNRVLPYFTREEIDGQGMLHGRGLELVWVDPIDAFFLQIQGSGTVKHRDESEEHIVYADKNGHRYEAIGKFLKSRIAPKPITTDRIETELRAMSDTERDSILFKNPSYVFFGKSRNRAITSLGVSATPGRTIATDPKFTPKGALAWLEFSKPSFESKMGNLLDEPEFVPASRFVVDQDTGGAITGTNRVDLFWGRGDEAKRHAGVMQHKARLIYLAPNPPQGSHH
jgi:membrane-bound lytic murein transglycosylase A